MRTSRVLPGLLVALLLVPLSRAVGEEPTALSQEVTSPVVLKDLRQLGQHEAERPEVSDAGGGLLVCASAPG